MMANGNDFDTEMIAEYVRRLLLQLDEDGRRPELDATPQRVAGMFAEVLSGYKTPIEEVTGGAVIDQPGRHEVLVRDIQFYSMCEHHMLPFYGKASISYISVDKIVGLGRLPRIVHYYARRLQTQERLTAQIAGLLGEVLSPMGLAVQLEGTHLCSAMRGEREGQMRLVTSQFRGVYELDFSLQARFAASIQ